MLYYFTMVWYLDIVSLLCLDGFLLLHLVARSK